MTAYRTPKVLPGDFRVLPAPEEQERILAECREVDEANAKAWADLMTRWSALKRDARDLVPLDSMHLPSNHPTRVWWAKGPLETSLHHHRRPWREMMESTFANLRIAVASAETKKREEQRKQHEALKPARAVVFLIQHGKEEGKDFTVEGAVSTANELARAALIAEKMAQGGPFSFSGEDNCENCEGWDGESHRCECGNRRVGWTMEGDFEDFAAGTAYVYGEAY